MLSLIIEFIIYTIFIKGANLDVVQILIIYLMFCGLIVIEVTIYYNIYYNWEKIKKYLLTHK